MYKIEGKVKNNIGNGEPKELVCMAHGHELRVGECWWEEGCRSEGNKGEVKNGTTVIVLLIKYT